DKEMTSFSGEVHRDRLDDYYATLRELLLTPGWRESDFVRVKTRLINAIRTDLRSDNDEELGKEVLYASIYSVIQSKSSAAEGSHQSISGTRPSLERHPNGHLNLGAAGDLQKLTLDNCRAFYRRHYTTGNLTLGLGGGYPDDFAGRVKCDFGALEKAATPAV